MVLLPEEKQPSWVNDIKYAQTSTEIKTDTLELLIGKPNHTANIKPARMILLKPATPLTEEKEKWGTQRLQLWNQLDLQLWIKLLQHVTTKGVPFKNTVFVKPSVTL